MNTRNSKIMSYSSKEAFEALLSTVKSSFKKSIDVAINLNVDVRKSEEQIRGTVLLPAGIGREVKVCVIANNEEHLREAKEASADLYGGKDFVDIIKNDSKKINDIDWVISTPDTMPIISSISKILGPKGLMPNPKFGTVTNDIQGSVKKIKSGLIRFKSDKNGIIHAKIGDIKFKVEDLLENFDALIKAIKDLKPSSVKGAYFKDIFICSTMGKSFKVNIISN